MRSVWLSDCETACCALMRNWLVVHLDNVRKCEFKDYVINFETLKVCERREESRTAEPCIGHERGSRAPTADHKSRDEAGKMF